MNDLIIDHIVLIEMNVILIFYFAWLSKKVNKSREKLKPCIIIEALCSTLMSFEF